MTRLSFNEVSIRFASEGYELIKVSKGYHVRNNSEGVICKFPNLEKAQNWINENSCVVEENIQLEKEDDIQEAENIQLENEDDIQEIEYDDMDFDLDYEDEYIDIQEENEDENYTKLSHSEYWHKVFDRIVYQVKISLGKAKRKMNSFKDILALSKKVKISLKEKFKGFRKPLKENLKLLKELRDFKQPIYE